MHDPLEMEGFYQVLGYAITRWQLVEGGAYQVYTSLMRGADPTLVSVGFHHIQSFEARLQLVTRCIFFVKSDETRAAWEPVRKKAEKLAGIRNELVHSGFGIQVTSGRARIRIAPSFYDATAIVKNRAMNEHYTHDAERIIEHANAFDQLAAEMESFRKAHDFTIATKQEREAARKSSSSKPKGRSA